MFEIEFTTADWSMDASGTWLRLKAESSSSVRSFLDAMKSDKKYVAAIKEWRQKRSLDANAYCWVLLNKLANKLNMPVTDLYRHYIPDVPYRGGRKTAQRLGTQRHRLVYGYVKK